MKALRCPFCGYIWLPRYARLPKCCPKCHRYFTKQKPLGTVEVPDSYFEKPKKPPEIKPVALPEPAEVTCARCGEKTRHAGMIEGKLYCPNCVVQIILEKEVKSLDTSKLQSLGRSVS